MTATDDSLDMLRRAASAAEVMGLPRLATLFGTAAELPPSLRDVTWPSVLPLAAELAERFDAGAFEGACFEHELTDRYPAAAAVFRRVAAGLREAGVAHASGNLTMRDDGARMYNLRGHGFAVAKVLGDCGLQVTSLSRDDVFFDPHPEQQTPGSRYSILTGEELPAARLEGSDE